MKAQIGTAIVLVIAIGLALVVTGVAFYLQPPEFFPPGDQPGLPGSVKLNKFSSLQELKDYVQASSATGAFGGFYGGLVARESAVPLSAPAAAAKDASLDYSITNIQVAGVDEADILKNDGKYIYAVSGSKIVIVDAFPPENAKILSEIKLGGQPAQIFVNGDRLVAFGNYQPFYGYPVLETLVARADVAILPPYAGKMFVQVYDISDRSNPVLAKNITADGNYFGSRMIGDFVYVIVNSPLYGGSDIIIPRIVSDGKVLPAEEFPDVYYLDYPDYSYMFTNIMSLNVKSGEDPASRIYLMGTTNNMYVSRGNIYITHMKHRTKLPLTGLDFYFSSIEMGIGTGYL